MRIEMKCADCGATGWGRGIDEPDVNATTITEFPDEWEGGDPLCQHEGEMEITDAEEIYSLDD